GIRPERPQLHRLNSAVDIRGCALHFAAMDAEMTMLECEEAMTKAVEYAIHEFAAVRTGKASPGLVEGLDVFVHSYGSHMKLKQLAMISTPDARLIRIEPFDASTLTDIDRAIRESRLGLNGSIEGK